MSLIEALNATGAANAFGSAWLEDYGAMAWTPWMPPSLMSWGRSASVCKMRMCLDSVVAGDRRY